MKRIAILFCMLTAWPASAWSETTREQQATHDASNDGFTGFPDLYDL